MTGFNGMGGGDRPLTPEDDELILTLWREGNDTLDICQKLKRSEAQIANRLPRLLEQARRNEDWETVALYRK